MRLRKSGDLTKATLLDKVMDKVLYKISTNFFKL